MQRIVRKLVLGTWIHLKYAHAVIRLRNSRTAGLILRYHSVAPPDNLDYIATGISIPPDVFEDHIRLLNERYNIITLSEILERARHGYSKQQPPAVAITFDDGYRDNFLYAAPILRKYRAPATIYVVTGAIHPAPPVWTARLSMIVPRLDRCRSIDGLPFAIKTEDNAAILTTATKLVHHLRQLPRSERDLLVGQLEILTGMQSASKQVMLSKQELLAMDEQGITLGAHTCSHPLLPSIDASEAAREILDSKSTLEAILGHPVHDFSYPNPGGGIHHSKSIRQYVTSAHYRTAVTSEFGLIDSTVDPIAIRRVGVNRGRTQKILFRHLGLRGVVDG